MIQNQRMMEHTKPSLILIQKITTMNQKIIKKVTTLNAHSKF